MKQPTSSRKRTEFLHIRLKQSDKELLRNAAASVDEPISIFARRLILQGTRAIASQMLTGRD